MSNPCNALFVVKKKFIAARRTTTTHGVAIVLFWRCGLVKARRETLSNVRNVLLVIKKKLLL